MNADFVVCNNCGKQMYVVVGTDVCPKCMHRGTLTWASDNEDDHMVDAFESDIVNWSNRKNVYNEKETAIND